MPSFRCDLDADLYEKLGRIANERGATMTDVFRDWIYQERLATPEERVEHWIKTHGTAYGKMIFWQSHQSDSLFEIGNKRIVDSKSLIREAIRDVVAAKTGAELRDAMSFWNRHLESRNKALLLREAASWAALSELRDKDREGVWNVSVSSWYDLAAGEYFIHREPVRESFHAGGENQGVETINAYGASVLNAHHMAIIDVDLEDSDTFASGVAIQPDKEVALFALREFQEKHPELGFRVYRTHSGLRYICTTEEFLPRSLESHRMMRSLMADPRYRALCSFQETYRARLTPKPWRWLKYSGFSKYDNEEITEEFAEAEDYAVCRLIEVVGPDKIIDPFAKMIERHDEATKALKSKSAILI